MEPLSAVRSQMPVQPPTPQAAADRPVTAAAAQSARPVGETLRREAVQQPSGLAAQIAVELSDRERDHHPAAEARAAAEAARDAYIKASIAAGVSPLPLP